MKYAYYPGCAAEATIKEADKATRAVAKHIGIELVDFPNMSCCGAGVLHEERPNLSVAINARNFAIAEKAGLDLLTICNTCLLGMIKSKKELDENDELRERINKKLAKFGLEYKGEVKIKHLLWVLIEDYGLERLSKYVKKSLSGIKIAPFYGCHILRPQEILGFEDGRDPDSLEKVIELTGATATDYDQRTDCCGFHVMLVNKKATTGMVGDCLSGAGKSGADLVVTPCTLCQLTLDSYQYMADKEATKPHKLPVIHLPQLVGLALGIETNTLGFNKHMVELPKGLLK
jgi:succinate dehydrogenase / fumarate reductase cytochrome b subunit